MVLAPDVWQVDLAVTKRLRFARRYNLELRGEFFNLLNHPCFYLGDQNINNTQFGRLTDVAVGARIVQLGVRLDF